MGARRARRRLASHARSSVIRSRFPSRRYGHLTDASGSVGGHRGGLLPRREIGALDFLHRLPNVGHGDGDIDLRRINRLRFRISQPEPLDQERCGANRLRRGESPAR